MKIKMLVELDYDAVGMHGEDKESKLWFMENILLRRGITEPLLLHCNEIGDTVGEIKVLEVHPF